MIINDKSMKANEDQWQVIGNIYSCYSNIFFKPVYHETHFEIVDFIKYYVFWKISREFHYSIESYWTLNQDLHHSSSFKNIWTISETLY